MSCDAWREPDCHREYAAVGEPKPVAIDHVRKEAGTAGWTREFVRGEVFTMDVCPACTGSKAPIGRPEFLYMS